MKNMTTKTKVWFVIDSLIVLGIVLITMYLSVFCDMITIPYVGTISKVVLWVISSAINIHIVIYFLFFWWCENRWRNIKNKFRRRG